MDSSLYKAPWSFSLKAITAFSLILFLVPPVILLVVTVDDTVDSLVSAGYFGAMLWLVIWMFDKNP